MTAPLDVTIERWWIRDAHNPHDLAWRAIISGTGLGITSAADSTPWRALARCLAHLELKRHGLDAPAQAQEELTSIMARARAAAALAKSMAAPARRRRTA
jgi:hypothetical protein